MDMQSSLYTFGCSKSLFVFGCLICSIGNQASATNDDPDFYGLADFSLMELLQVKITSASRQPEKLSESPSAVQVITADQIRRSGATSIPEALRLASNLNVTQKGSGAWIISARGFVADTGNKLLVMIDGRTVHTPIFSGVFWDRQNYLLADIERIEVVSGPGATLWGSNAVPAGVLHDQLANYFSVSRTPIRAVLQRLENESLLTIKPKLGCFIRNIDILLISRYYDVRVVIENLVLEEISKLQDFSPLKMLSQSWQPEVHHFGLDITDELMLAEENFHLDLAKMTKNPVLIKYVSDINDNIRVVRRLGWTNAKSVTDTYAEHFRVCDLLLKKKLADAQFELTDHIRKSQDQASRITLNQLYANHKAITFD